MNETYQILSAALSFHQAFDQAKVDGKINVQDLPLLLVPLMKLPDAISGAGNALAELKALDPQQRADLLSKLSAEYDLANDVLEAKIEAGIEWLLSTGKFVGILVAKPPVA